MKLSQLKVSTSYLDIRASRLLVKNFASPLQAALKLLHVVISYRLVQIHNQRANES